MKRSGVRFVSRRLSCVHGGDAVGAAVLSIWRGDADVKCLEAAGKRSGEHVGGPKEGAWDEVWRFELGARIDGDGGVENDFGDPVMPSGDFGLGTA